jgi:hypothetical protein
MPLVGVGQAARLSGKNRSTLHRAMKDGRLSFSLDETGERRIDTSELERVFGARVPHGNGAQQPQSGDVQRGEIELLRQWLADRDETIRDLRQRLDAADHRLTALLARSEHQAQPAPSTTEQPRPLGRRVLDWLIKQHV